MMLNDKNDSMTINNEKQNLRTHQDLAYYLNTTSITLTPCTQVPTSLKMFLRPRTFDSNSGIAQDG